MQEFNSIIRQFAFSSARMKLNQSATQSINQSWILIDCLIAELINLMLAGSVSESFINSAKPEFLNLINGSLNCGKGYERSQKANYQNEWNECLNEIQTSVSWIALTQSANPAIKQINNLNFNHEISFNCWRQQFNSIEWMNSRLVWLFDLAD